MKYWFIGCTHFGHKNIIKLSDRPFSDIEQHDDYIIDSWNKLVSNEDIVYHLGDIAWNQSYENYKRIFKMLKGRKNVILGNHDGKQALIRCQKEGIIENIWEKKTIQIDKDVIYLQHIPAREWVGFYNGVTHLYAHTHGNINDYCRSTDVSVECWEYEPVDWEELKEYLKDYENIHM